MDQIKLEQLILEHKQAYYTGNPLISDKDYDDLEDQLRSLDPESPVLALVGFNSSENKVIHDKPMLSLNKVREVSDLVSWASDKPCLISAKVDGLAVSLIYRNGRFFQAKTRGDGLKGQDATKHLAYVPFPKTIDTQEDIIEIRGELCITFDNFDKLSKEIDKRSLPGITAIRNSVAGLLHKKTDLDLCSYLCFKAYDLIPSLDTELSIFQKLKDLNFEVPANILSDSSKFEAILAKIASTPLAYLTDGVVFAFNDKHYQESLGLTGHHPKGKIAFKFKSETAETTIKSIEVDVGRTGKLSFVGIVEPVYLSGAEISKVTLHNKKYVEQHQLNTGAVIEITRSGEVIPKHIQTIKPAAYSYPFPLSCPSCNGSLILSETGVDLLCTNLFCPARSEGNLALWISTNEIENIGSETLKQIIEAGLISHVADFYKLTVEDLQVLPRVGKRLATKIIKNIDKSRQIPFEKFLTGLSIEGLGKSLGKLLATKYKDTDTFFKVLENTPEDLLTLEGVGDILYNNICRGMADKGWDTLQRLRQVGVEVEGFVQLAEQILEGKIIVITGNLSKHRNIVKNWIENRGGKVTSSVSAKTDYLICNSVSSSSKYKKALELEIPIVNEETFFKEFQENIDFTLNK
jgi:DNA ligase (NAD+)